MYEWYHERVLSEIVYPEELLTYLLELVSEVKKHSITKENKCHATLFTIYANKLKVCVVQDEVESDYMSLRDPADRPAELTDHQKQTISLSHAMRPGF